MFGEKQFPYRVSALSGDGQRVRTRFDRSAGIPQPANSETFRRVATAAPEANPFGREPIHVRRDHRGMSARPHCVPSVLIGEQVDDIGTGGLRYQGAPSHPHRKSPRGGGQSRLHEISSLHPIPRRASARSCRIPSCPLLLRIMPLVKHLLPPRRHSSQSRNLHKNTPRARGLGFPRPK